MGSWEIRTLFCVKWCFADVNPKEIQIWAGAKGAVATRVGAKTSGALWEKGKPRKTGGKVITFDFLRGKLCQVIWLESSFNCASGHHIRSLMRALCQHLCQFEENFETRITVENLGVPKWGQEFSGVFMMAQWNCLQGQNCSSKKLLCYTF